MKRRKRYWNELRGRIREPLLVDRRIDICSAANWLLLGAWGVFSAISAYDPIRHVAGEFYNQQWGMAIGLLGLIAAVAAASTLIYSGNVRIRLAKKYTELWALSLMTGLVSVAPLLRYVQMVERGFTPDSIASAAVTTFFLVFPTWRIFHLTERIRGLRKLLEA